MVNTWKRGVRARAAKKQKTPRELICRHDSRRIPGLLDEQTKLLWQSEVKSTNARSLEMVLYVRKTFRRVMSVETETEEQQKLKNKKHETKKRLCRDLFK